MERVWVPPPVVFAVLIQNLVRFDPLVTSMPSHIQGPGDNLVSSKVPLDPLIPGIVVGTPSRMMVVEAGAPHLSPAMVGPVMPITRSYDSGIRCYFVIRITR